MKTTSFFSALLGVLFFISVTSCQPDSLDDAICLNGGVSINGVCDCPDGFERANCDLQTLPDKIRIRSVQVTRFPGFNHDAQWDDADGPDLYFRLYRGDEPLSQPRLDIPNADSEQDYYFFIEIMDLYDVTDVHTFELRDYDYEDDDDILGSVTFTPYHDTNGFPATLVLDNGGKVAFTIELQYYFDQD